MTQVPEPTPQLPEQSRRRSRRFLKALALTGISCAAIGSLGYMGLNYWVRQHLPGLLSAELSKVLDRPVQVGRVEGFTLRGIRIGETTLPQQLGAPESLAIGSIDVGYSLPGLLRRSLPVSISLNNISVSAQQTVDGTWVSLAPKLPKWQDLPVNLNVRLRIKDAQAVLRPYGNIDAVTIPINGTVNLAQDRRGQARYDATITLAGGRLKAKGDTQLKTGKSRLKAQVQNLGLAQFNPLNPLTMARLTQGRLDADLDIAMADFSFKNLPMVTGTAQVSNVEVRADQLAAPLTAQATVLFQGNRAVIQQTQGSLGDATATVSGTVDWAKGLKDAAMDLAIDVPEVNLKSLQQTLTVDLPIALDGSFQGSFQLTGTLSDPIVTGDFGNQTPTQVDQVGFSQVQGRIEGNRSRLALVNFQAIPTAGGYITAQGHVTVPPVLTNLDPLQWPIGLDFQTQLPADRLAASYGAPKTVRLGTVSAQGSVRGVLGNPEAVVAWQLPEGHVERVGTISGGGRALLADYRLSLADTALEVGQGNLEITGGAELTSLGWQLFVTAANLDLSGFKPTPGVTASQGTDQRDCFGRACPKRVPAQAGVLGGFSELTNLWADSRPLPPLNARLALSGNLNGLLSPNPTTTIVLDAVTATLAAQTVTARGRIDLAKDPDWAAALAMDVALRSTLSQLPIRSIVSDPVADQVTLGGNLDFKGQLLGRNLLGNLLAPGNIRLVGDMTLQNLVANRLPFEPRLTGRIDAGLGRVTSLTLRGENDRVIASLDPCLEARCPFLYVPNSLDIRLGDTKRPILIAGTRQSDRFRLDLQGFNTALLALSPGRSLGIPGPIVGTVNADLTLNLYTLATTGSVRIERPGLGYLQTDEFAGSFAHDRGQLSLSSAFLRLGSSRYDVAAALNLGSGDIKASVDARGNIQDLLTLLGLSTLTDLPQGLRPPDPVGAEALAVNTVGAAGEGQPSLATLLETLAAIAPSQPPRPSPPPLVQPPTQLAVDAGYSGTITLSGSITDPQISFAFQGENWQWYPDPKIVTVKNGEIVIDRGRVWTVDRVIAQGQFQDGQLTIEPARAEFAGAVANFQGVLSLADISGAFSLDTFPLEILQQVVALPADLRGTFSAQGTLAGELFAPQVEGNLTLAKTTINTTPLEPILGTFRYADTWVDLATTQPEAIQVKARVPITSGERLSLEVNLGTDAIALLGALSRNQLTLVAGNGSVALQAGATLNLTKPGLDQIIATGAITLQGITFKTPLLADALTLDGDILLTANRLRIENLLGKFANSRLIISGALGLTEPLPKDDPDAAFPLTVAITAGRLDLATAYGSYNGQVETQIAITRSLLSPLITGRFRLYEGGIFLSQNTLALADTLTASGSSNPFAALGNWKPELENFEVTLGDGFSIEVVPVALVRPGGTVTINGPLDRLRPEGVIQVNRGSIDLLSTVFYLPRNRPHTVTFSPEAGILNPALDIQFQTITQESPTTQRRTAVDNEIRQDIIPNLRPEEIYIYLTIEGDAQDLVAELQKAQSCEFRDTGRGFIGGPFSPEELDRLATCLQVAKRGGRSRDRQVADRQLITSSIVKLESDPQRSEGQIVTLLGDESLALIEDIQDTLQRGDEGEIVQFFGYRYLVAPTLRDTVADINDFTKTTGQNLGLTDLRILPTLRASRQVGSQSFVDVEYDYSASQSRLLFRSRF